MKLSEYAIHTLEKRIQQNNIYINNDGIKKSEAETRNRVYNELLTNPEKAILYYTLNMIIEPLDI